MNTQIIELEIERSSKLGEVLGVAKALIIRAENDPKIVDILLGIRELDKAMDSYDEAAKAYLMARTSL
jgi:hypothetical protein